MNLGFVSEFSTMNRVVGAGIYLFCMTVISGCVDSEREAAFDELQGHPMPLAVQTQASTGSLEPIRPLPDIAQDDLLTPIVSLGRTLFHDKRLSGDQTVSCASCHDLSKGGADGLRSSVGINGQIGPINAPSVFNSGFNFRHFWDGRAATLEEQAAEPVKATIEMGSNWAAVVAELQKDDTLSSRFEEAFASSGISESRILFALARYQESLITPAPFDKFLVGQTGAISREAAQGYELFKNYGCVSCHQGVNVGGNLYQQFGAVQQVDLDSFLREGMKPVIKPRDQNVSLVKVPSLRNVELTAPYFHAGKIKDLATAVRVMGLSQTGTDIPRKDITLIVEFLKSLTGDWQQHASLVE